jgi:hypothetical protein
MVNSVSIPAGDEPAAQPADRVAIWPCVGIGLICVLSVVVLAAWPRAGTPVAVVFAPWVSLDDIHRRTIDAGGQLIDFGGVTGVVVAQSAEPAFVKRLYAQGALWVLDGNFTASLCALPVLLKEGQND